MTGHTSDDARSGRTPAGAAADQSPSDRRTGGLSRPREGRVLGGVCAGLAQRFGVSPLTVRVLFVASCLLPGPQFVLYLALWLLLPQGD